MPGARAADVVLFLAADAHHHRRVGLLRQQRRNRHRHGAGAFAAEAAAAVLADEHDVRRRRCRPSSPADRPCGRRSASSRADTACRSASRPSRCAFPSADGRWTARRRSRRRRRAAFLKPASRSPYDHSSGALPIGSAPSGADGEILVGPLQRLDLRPRRRARRARRRRRRREPDVAFDAAPLAPPGRRLSTGSTTNGSGSRSSVDALDRLGGRDLVDRGDGENRLALIERLVGQRALGAAQVGQIVGGEDRLDAGHAPAPRACRCSRTRACGIGLRSSLRTACRRRDSPRRTSRGR